MSPGRARPWRRLVFPGSGPAVTLAYPARPMPPLTASRCPAAPGLTRSLMTSHPALQHRQPPAGRYPAGRRGPPSTPGSARPAAVQASTETGEHLHHVPHRVTGRLPVIEYHQPPAVRRERGLGQFGIHPPEPVAVLDHHRWSPSGPPAACGPSPVIRSSPARPRLPPALPDRPRPRPRWSASPPAGPGPLAGHGRTPVRTARTPRRQVRRPHPGRPAPSADSPAPPGPATSPPGTTGTPSADAHPEHAPTQSDSRYQYTNSNTCTLSIDHYFDNCSNPPPRAPGNARAPRTRTR